MPAAIHPMQNKPIILYPIGPIDTSILDYLSERISFHLDLSCIIDPEIEVPYHTYNKIRDQYDAKLILKHLLSLCPPDTLKLVGVTKVDLFVPILKYVFGVAQIEGPSSLISLNRLYPQFYDQPPNSDLLMERTEKTAVHELGHTFGLTHCRDRNCVMYSSIRIADTDRKNSRFCPTCHELFKWHLEA